MVDQAARSTHTIHLSETIHFQAPTASINPREIASFYVDKRLSVAQVGERLGCSKAYVLLTLKRQGLLRHKRDSHIDPTNYRNPVPPFGYRVVDGKLTTNAAELKVCRLVVDLIDRHGLNFQSAGQHLSQKGIKNRRGAATWHNYTVSRIYQRWKGKL